MWLTLLGCRCITNVSIPWQVQLKDIHLSLRHPSIVNPFRCSSSMLFAVFVSLSAQVWQIEKKRKKMPVQMKWFKQTEISLVKLHFLDTWIGLIHWLFQVPTLQMIFSNHYVCWTQMNPAPRQPCKHSFIISPHSQNIRFSPFQVIFPSQVIHHWASAYPWANGFQPTFLLIKSIY